MGSMLRQFRRSPGRIAASVFALALAVGAIGVLAVPTVSESALDEAVASYGLGDLIVPTTPLDAAQLDAVRALPDVAAAEGSAVLAVDLAGEEGRLVGLEPGNTMDVVVLASGRMPVADDEVVVSPGVAEPGAEVTAAGRTFTVVGTGDTLWWQDADALYTTLAAVRPLVTDGGTNHLVISAVDDDEDSLRALAAEVRALLVTSGDTFTDFPVQLPDGTTPIDADIRQVSTLIGMLGIVAGLVALVLLASTTSTLITERTREVAVMRALGARRRPLRRRLRRIALGITVAALALGLPLGVLISNLIARMVLERFVGITPDVAVDWRVLAGSALAALLGARVVSARAARRITALPLADALRDRDGAPFGRTAVQRLAARSIGGGLLSRIATRSSLRRPGRTIAVVAQIGAAVAVAFLVPTLATSVNEYNEAAHATWQWDARVAARDPGLPLDAALADATPGAETGVWVWGEIDDWEVEVFGVAASSAVIDADLRAGRWITGGSREAVVSAGFAERTDIAVGDTVDLELASGPAAFEVVGLADDYSRAVYADRDVVATTLGSPGSANVVWATDAVDEEELAGAIREAGVAVDAVTASEMRDEEGRGRDAIVVIFGAIGAIVAGVASLAVLSSMLVSLAERRHELATLQAMGARRRRLRGLLARELVPLGLAGLAIGLPLGALGARGVIGSFEASNAVDIGVVDAVGAVPYIVVATLLVLVLLASVVVRSAARRPIAVTLRGAA